MFSPDFSNIGRNLSTIRKLLRDIYIYIQGKGEKRKTFCAVKKINLVKSFHEGGMGRSKRREGVHTSSWIIMQN